MPGVARPTTSPAAYPYRRSNSAFTNVKVPRRSVMNMTSPAAFTAWRRRRSDGMDLSGREQRHGFEETGDGTGLVEKGLVLPQRQTCREQAIAEAGEVEDLEI